MNGALARLRQSHAIEHATVAVLLQRRGRLRMRVAGLSHPGGFLLSTAAGADEIESAAHEALVRLAAGETQLALSEHCGTTLALGALLTATAGRLAFASGGTFSRAVLWSALALAATPPAGFEIQRRLTTGSDVALRAITGARAFGRTPLGPLVHVSIA